MGATIASVPVSFTLYTTTEVMEATEATEAMEAITILAQFLVITAAKLCTDSRHSLRK